MASDRQPQPRLKTMKNKRLIRTAMPLAIACAALFGGGCGWCDGDPIRYTVTTDAGEWYGAKLQPGAISSRRPMLTFEVDGKTISVPKNQVISAIRE